MLETGSNVDNESKKSKIKIQKFLTGSF